jgi:hypothetical protein
MNKINKTVDRLMALYEAEKNDKDFQDIILFKIWELEDRKNYKLTSEQSSVFLIPLLIFKKDGKHDLIKSDWENNKYKDLIFKKI